MLVIWQLMRAVSDTATNLQHRVPFVCFFLSLEDISNSLHRRLLTLKKSSAKVADVPKRVSSAHVRLIYLPSTTERANTG